MKSKLDIDGVTMITIKKRPAWSIGAVAIGISMLISSAMAADYDLVILDGRVMDPETMYDDVANVGIKDGRIATITKQKITGRETIKAKGLVVAPGFIDTHYHATDVFASKMALRDGVTTGMDLEAGSFNVKGWYDEKAKSGWQVNYGTSASLLYSRMAVHDPETELDAPIDYGDIQAYAAKALADGVQGWADTRSSVEQMNKVLQIVDEDLRQGAIGIAAPIAYMAKGITSYELFAGQRAGAHYGRLTSVHTRYHLLAETPTEAPIAFDEMFANAMLLGAPLLIAHNNDYGWWEIEEKLQLARAKGLNMWSEYYPYAAGSTAITAAFLRPSEWVEKKGYRYEDTIYDPIDDEYLTNDSYAALMKNDPGRSVVVEFPYRKEWMNYWLSVPHMTIASDAMAGVGEDGKLLPWDADWSEYRGHPRTSGSRGATFRMAREQGVPLMFTIAQASYWAAKHMGDAGLEAMKDRGRLQVGKVADITIFDAKTITDNSGFKVGQHGIPTTGIPYVVINGTIVVKDSKVLPVKPGQEIRYPIEDKGRFKPVNVEGWLNEHTIGLNPDVVEADMDDTTGAGAPLQVAE
jgi:N-acyl-D-glutamate deacylase